MKQIAALVLALLPLPAVAQSVQQNVVDEVIWVVGDTPILLSDVEETRISQEMRRQPVENPYCTIPEQIAIQKLFLHQAALDSVEVSEGDIIRSVDEEINYYIMNLGSRENVESWARKSISQLREQLKQQQREQLMIRQVQQSITKNIKITPAEVREYFKKLPEDSLPYIPTQVEVQIITSKPEPTRTEIERVESELREFARRVNEGETEFSTLARFYSQDASARNGGELGYSGKNQWVPEFANVAFSLNDPKKVSKIVKTEFGYHILQLIDKRGDRVNVRHILLKPEIEEEEYERRLLRLDSIADDIRAGKFTFDEAAYALSDDKETRANHGVMVFKNEEDRSVSARFKMDDLPQDVARVVAGMQVGEVSKAFRMTDNQNQTYCAIVRLKKRIDGHRAGLTEDFQTLKDVVYEKRAGEVIDKWVRDKIRSTYVRIGADWRGCSFKYPDWIK
ncbi:MAG: peptidylprolyl isomerase [Prevotellaceae bacterium]|nr:peptidylprolyl isomerase [Prevotellaceae bacterium]